MTTTNHHEPRLDEPSRPSLMARLHAHAQLRPQQAFVSDAETGESYDFATIYQLARGFCRFLSAQGVEAGDRVLLIIGNHWAFFALLAACAARGVRLVPANPKLHPDELAYLIEHSSPSLSLVSDRDQRVGEQISDWMLLSTAIEAAQKEVESADQSDASLGQGVIVEPSAPPCLLIYTSGTTGSAKAVMLTEHNLTWMADALVDAYRVRDDDVSLCVLPVYHMHAVMLTGCVMLTAGARIIISDLVRDDDYWHQVATHGVTICGLVPSVMSMLLMRDPEGTKHDIGKVRFTLCGAAPLSAQLWRRFERTFNVPVFQGYGLTETTTWASHVPPDEPRRYDSVGVPLGCDIRIDHSALSSEDTLFADRRHSPTTLHGDYGNRRGRGNEPRVLGEVLIRGHALMRGYYGDEAQTHEMIGYDGFLRTGDIGFFDADGFLHVVARKKELVKRNGISIVPAEVDQVISQHPAAAEVKSIGLPSLFSGEELVTAFVARDDVEPPSTSELKKFVTARASAHKCPDRVVVMGYLPRGSTGKVAVAHLANIVWGNGATAAFEGLASDSNRFVPEDHGRHIVQLLQRSWLQGDDVRFTVLWGCGVRDTVTRADRRALARLQRAMVDVTFPPYVSSEATLLLTDVLAEAAGRPKERVHRYFTAITRSAEALGIGVMLESELRAMAAAEGELDSVDDAVSGGEGMLEHLLDETEDGELATAERLASALLACGPVLEATLGDTILVSFDDPQLEPLLPLMPTVFFRQQADEDGGTSIKPWLLGGEAKR